MEVVPTYLSRVSPVFLSAVPWNVAGAGRTVFGCCLVRPALAECNGVGAQERLVSLGLTVPLSFADKGRDLARGSLHLDCLCVGLRAGE